MNQCGPLVGISDVRLAQLFKELVHELGEHKLQVTTTSGQSLSAKELVNRLEDKVISKQLQHYPLPSLNVRHCEAGLVHTSKSFRMPIFPVAPLEVMPKNDVHLSSLLSETQLRLRDRCPPFSAFQVTVTMKLPAQCSGWASRLAKKGYRVSSRAARFGRQEHVIKKDGVHLSIIQGGSVVIHNKLHFPSPEVLSLLGDLREVGALMN